jgi:hypothetical protein
MSQQIGNSERELGTLLFIRERRHVEFTPAGSQLLTDAREVLDAASRAFDRARKGGGELPLRLGYVSWIPQRQQRYTTLASVSTNEPSRAILKQGEWRKAVSIWLSPGLKTPRSNGSTCPPTFCGTRDSRHPADSRSRHSDSAQPRLDLWLANTSLRAGRASGWGRGE